MSDYAFYYARIQTFTGNGIQYIILSVPAMYAHSKVAHSHELEWNTLQTRILNDVFDIPEQTLDYKLFEHRYVNPSDKINLLLKERNMQHTEYYCNLPFQVIIYHDPKVKSMYQFSDTLDLRQALNTYKCLIKKL